MRIRIGCEMTYELPGPTPMIALLNVHHSRMADLERPDTVTASPSVPLTTYRDGYDNRCTRLVAPAGRFVLGVDSVVRDDGLPDLVLPDTGQAAVEDLPSETLVFLLGSRYCETDLLSDEAWRLFGNTPPGWPRVQAICDLVHRHIAFGYPNSRPTRTAAEAWRSGSASAAISPISRSPSAGP